MAKHLLTLESMTEDWGASINFRREWRRRWVKTPGIFGSKCFVRYNYGDALEVQHCGHQTALWPFTGAITWHDGSRTSLITTPSGRGFQKALDCQFWTFILWTRHLGISIWPDGWISPCEGAPIGHPDLPCES